MLNLVESRDVKSSWFRHDLWTMADKESDDNFICRLPLTLTIVGQYVTVMLQRRNCNPALIDDMVQEAVAALQVHVHEIEAGIATDGKLKFTVHNAIARFLHHTFREPDPHDVAGTSCHYMKQDLKLDLDIIIRDKRERDVINMLTYGMTQAEIGFELGVTQVTIHRVINDIRVKVEAYLRG